VFGPIDRAVRAVPSIKAGTEQTKAAQSRAFLSLFQSYIATIDPEQSSGVADVVLCLHMSAKNDGQSRQALRFKH
jgi:hypothetical protein